MKKTVFSKNNPVFSFEVNESNQVTRALSIENDSLLPILLMGKGHFNIKNIEKWLSERRIPETRDDYKNAEAMFSIHINGSNHLLSLNDSYWIPESEDDLWEDMNFFTNRYQTEFGRMFFSPWTVNKEDLSLESPDTTTAGVCAKRWCQPSPDLSVSYLIKKGSVFGHQDPLFEIISSVTLEKLKLIPFVRYEYTIDGLSVCSKCQNFITEDTEYVPALHVLKYEEKPEERTYYEHFLYMCEKFGIENAEDFLDRMFLADTITMNDDRNFLNFGFIRDSDTGKLISFSPLFDNGSVLLSKPKERKMKFEDKYVSSGIKRALLLIDSKEIFGKIKKEVFRLIDDYPFIDFELKTQLFDKLSKNYSKFESAIKPEEKKKAIPAPSLENFASLYSDL